MLKSYQKSPLIILFVCFQIVIFGGFFITSNQRENGNNNSINIVYTKLKKKPYRTITDIKTLINIINNTSINSTGEKVLKELDGTTVVDNSNGHEYIILTHYKEGDSTYTLVPVANNKFASINKTWQKEHKK